MKIKKIEMNSRSIRIVWTTENADHESFLYRHSDYSWHLDPDTDRLLPVNKEALQKAVQEYLFGKKKQRVRTKKSDTWFADGRAPLAAK